MLEGFNVLYVEDDSSVRASVTETLELTGFTVKAFDNAESAIPYVEPGFRGIVISDVQLPEMDGFELLKRVSNMDPSVPVILVTGHGDISMAVQAMREGAYDFIEKPFQMERLVEVVTRAVEKRMLKMEVESLRRQLNDKCGIEAVLLGISPAIEIVRKKIINLANTSVDVLVVGETGTGKELVARCLHNHSQRHMNNFVAINCGGLPESLFESEIFGHEAGAFTSAGKRRIGKIEHANGGTLLLDEIESMPLPLQVKLLRTLQDRKIERLGSNQEIPVDFRIVTATKCDLKKLSEQQKFRNDLYYRLSVAIIELPPLRERREDIPILFEHFSLMASVRYKREIPPLSQQQMRKLMANEWVGNVRELRNMADRFVLGLGDVDGGIQPSVSTAALSLSQQMDIVEKELIEEALIRCAGRPLSACEMLGIAKKTLYDKIHRHGILIERYRSSSVKDEKISPSSEDSDITGAI